MSADGADELPEKTFFADRAKTGRANCKKCKQKIETDSLRIAKLSSNPFGEGMMKMWHHVPCIFEVFKRQRATTARIKSANDIGGWQMLADEDQGEILKHLSDFCTNIGNKTITNTKPNSRKADTLSNERNVSLSQSKNVHRLSDKVMVDTSSLPSSSTTSEPSKLVKANSELMDHRDNSFREFRRLCADLSNESSYTGKTALVKQLFTKGSDSSGFKGDILLWCRLLLPGAVKRVYNLQSKQLVKLFSRIFLTDLGAMLVDLEQGDVAETVKIFFEKSHLIKPTKKSILSLIEIDSFLTELSGMTKEDDQVVHFTNIAERCTSNDMKMIIRLVKHDLRINAGPKHILEAVHQDAYQAFQASRDITAIVSRAANQSNEVSKSMVSICLMTPLQPMLAEPCRALENAFKKCPHGMYAEIKYDGERVQVHKSGNEFKYFSRSLKPVLQHKISHFKDYIPDAFPHGQDLILDAEILMIDTKTGNPLPFGTLGKHKKTQFEEANVCLFVFDCIYFNGRVLTNTPMRDRRKILEDNMKEIKHHIMISEMEELHTIEELERMITKIFRLGLEGLVLKDVLSIYEPGKRHWLKVKKDYLSDGAMADSVDLLVLGAWYGTGSKGGMMSSFLMGVFDSNSDKWCTVTKVHGGHDDNTLAALQTELDMMKISKDAERLPSWLTATKSMIPDFVARDPHTMPVWEVTGAEFTKHEVHTAHGISIRFPRVTKIRDDKNWETATSLQELVTLYEKSKESNNFNLIAKKSDRSKNPPLKHVNKVSATIVEDTCKGVDVPVKKTKLISSPKHPLLNIFNGVRIVLPDTVKPVLERYFISYGGTSLKLSKLQESTHVVHVEGTTCDHIGLIHARHVDVKWLEDSIKLQSPLDLKMYAV